MIKQKILLMILASLIVEFVLANSTSDSLSRMILKKCNIKCDVNPFDTTINGVYFYDFVRNEFKSEFNEKNYNSTYQKYTVDGKYNIISDNKKFLMQAYEENGGTGFNYYTISYFRNSKNKCERLLKSKATNFVSERVQLGMRYIDFLKVITEAGLTINQNGEKIIYYCWYPKGTKCFDAKVPNQILCNAYFYEYHFVNNVLVKFGFGKVKSIPNW